jgi:hypothetical protein
MGEGSGAAGGVTVNPDTGTHGAVDGDTTHSHPHAANGVQPDEDGLHDHEPHDHPDGTADHGHPHDGAHIKQLSGLAEKWAKVRTATDYGLLPGLEKLELYYDLAAVDALGRGITGTFRDRLMQLAEWSTAYINDLEDNCFADIEGGGTKDDQGKTTPRSLRHYPHHPKGEGSSGIGGTVDKAHLTNALARIADKSNFQGGSAHLEDHATKLGIGDRGDGNQDNGGKGGIFADVIEKAFAAVNWEA